MEAAVQMQPQQMQAVQTAQGTYFRNVTGTDTQTATLDGMQGGGGFAALLMQMLMGGEPEAAQTDNAEQTDDAAFLDALKEDATSDAAMQMMAELFMTRPELLQYLDASVLAQFGGQSAQMLAQGQGGTMPGDMLALLSQLTQTMTSQPQAQTAQTQMQSLLQALQPQAQMQVVQTGAQTGAQDGAAFGQANFQRAVFFAQQNMNSDKANTEQAFAQLAQANGKQVRTEDGTVMAQAQGVMPQVQTAMPLEMVQGVPTEDLQTLLAQVKTGLQQAVQAKQEEYVIKLKPEGLGEITVRMAEHAGKITMELLATNVSTQRMLSSELSGLRQAMEPYNVVVSTGEAANAQNGTQMQQQAWQQNHAHQHNAQQEQTHYYGRDDAADAQDAFAAQAAKQAPSTELDTYI